MKNVLIVIETAGQAVRKASFQAISFGRQMQALLGGELHLLLIGSDVGSLQKEISAYGAHKLWVVDAPTFKHPLAGRYAQVIADVAQKAQASVVGAAATACGKDIYPRVATRLKAAMASDVIFVESASVFKRAMWAGNLIATVELSTAQKVVTIRPTEFESAQPTQTTTVVESVNIAVADDKSQFIEFKEVKSARPQLTEARVVVAGGRGTKGDFKPIELLADALGGAVGASRAACDAGWVPNDYQVGQTGKIVAPELYIAAGISGAIQHLAGMKASKTIVAINKDPEAPIFQVSDYGLVGDLFKAIPELIDAYQKTK